MLKAESLKRWRALEPGRDPLPVMRPIPYKASGSRYGACGIRIDGTPDFIDAVLSNLKSLLAGENAFTRLELARSEVKPALGRHFDNAEAGAQVCYVRLHRRGDEGVHAAAYDPELRQASLTYAAALGIS